MKWPRSSCCLTFARTALCTRTMPRKACRGGVGWLGVGGIRATWERMLNNFQSKDAQEATLDWKLFFILLCTTLAVCSTWMAAIHRWYTGALVRFRVRQTPCPHRYRYVCTRAPAGRGKIRFGAAHLPVEQSPELIRALLGPHNPPCRVSIRLHGAGGTWDRGRDSRERCLTCGSHNTWS